MKIIVFGGTGWLGHSIVLDLIRGGYDVTICSRGRKSTFLEKVSSVKTVSADKSDEAAMKDAKRVKVGDCELSYTYRKGAFSRRHYNARFEYDGVQYYVYLKTCNDVKFSQLMTEFFEGKLY